MFSADYVDANRLSARVLQVVGVADRFLPRVKVKVTFEYRPQASLGIPLAAERPDWKLSILEHRLEVGTGEQLLGDSGAKYDHIVPYFGKDYEYTLAVSRSAIQSIEARRKDDVLLLFNLGGICLETDGLKKSDARTFSIGITKEFSQAQWNKLLREVGYQDTWIFEVAKPVMADGGKFGAVARFLQEAEAELAAGSPDDVVSKCRKALDALDSALDEGEWKRVEAEIDRDSVGEAGRPAKSARILGLRDKTRDMSNIGPHADKYVVTYDDARLCFLLTVSIISYVSKVAGRAR